MFVKWAPWIFSHTRYRCVVKLYHHIPICSICIKCWLLFSGESWQVDKGVGCKDTWTDCLITISVSFDAYLYRIIYSTHQWCNFATQLLCSVFWATVDLSGETIFHDTGQITAIWLENNARIIQGDATIKAQSYIKYKVNSILKPYSIQFLGQQHSNIMDHCELT